METMSSRMVWLRKTLNMTQRAMCELIDCDFYRYKSLEQEKARVSEHEFGPLCKRFKNLSLFLAYGEKIDVEKLEASNEPLENLLAAKIKERLKAIDAEGAYLANTNMDN